MDGGGNIAGLGEETTEPENGPTLWDYRRAVSQFYAQACPTFLGRCLPEVVRVEEDDEGPHVIIELGREIPAPSRATIEGVREELEKLSGRLITRFHLDWLKISAKLN